MSQRRAKLPKGISLHRCPYCKGRVVLDDNRHVSSHQAPVCRGWDELMQQLGSSVRELGPEVLPYGDDRGLS